MIPTDLDRAQNLKHPDEESDRPRRDIWLALGVILAVLLAVLIGLWVVGDEPASAAVLSLL